VLNILYCLMATFFTMTTSSDSRVRVVHGWWWAVFAIGGVSCGGHHWWVVWFWWVLIANGGGFSLPLVGHGCGPSLLLQTWTEQKIIEDAAIKKLCQAFRTLNVGEGKAEQVDQVLSAISKMTKLDPSTLEFEDNPRTWEEAEQSVDTKC